MKCAFLQPVDVEPALRKQPCAIQLHECKRGKRRAALPPRMARLSKSFNSELCKICCLAFTAKSRRRYGNRIDGRNRCQRSTVRTDKIADLSLSESGNAVN